MPVHDQRHDALVDVVYYQARLDRSWSRACGVMRHVAIILSGASASREGACSSAYSASVGSGSCLSFLTSSSTLPITSDKSTALPLVSLMVARRNANAVALERA